MAALLGRVLVTGAGGWIGTALCHELERQGAQVIKVSRQARSGQNWISFGTDFCELGASWPQDVAAVVHLAARVHQMGPETALSVAQYQLTNTDATARIAQMAKHSGVTRFVYLSSIKAIAEDDRGAPLNENEPARPLDPYGVSKLQAERRLADLSDGTFLPTVLRIPLVYGPGVKANFANLVRAVQRGIPLPLGRAAAPRTLVGMDNLVSAITTCLEHPRARGELFHVADRESLSVCQLIEAIGAALGRPARLIDVPVSLLRTAGRLLGKSAQINRLTRPLRVDTTKIQSMLDWGAPHDIFEGLRRTCAPLRKTP